VTKLGRLVQAGKIGSIEEIFLFSLPVKESRSSTTSSRTSSRTRS